MAFRFILVSLFLIPSAQLSAHGGGLDSYGCHNEAATGTYHCHEGNYSGMSFDSKEDALAFFALQEEGGLEGITINTSIGLYRVTTVTGTLFDFHETLRDQVWFTGDARLFDPAKEFAGAINSQLGSPNIYSIPLYEDRYLGPFFVFCTYLDVSCSAGFNTSNWDPTYSIVSGSGRGGGGLGLAYTFAVANALPVVTIAGGNRVIPDTDGVPGEAVLLSVAASDTDGTLKEMGGEFQYANEPLLIIPGTPLDGNSSTFSIAAELPFPDGENVITLWVADDEGVKGSTTVRITVEEPAGYYDYDMDDYLTSWRDDDGDCINTRHEVLAIESLIEPAFDEEGCTVIAGLWSDPYTGESFTDPADLDIDHLVPLKEAHDSGARFWSQERKQAFANDMVMADALIAVDARANRSKGGDDPALWLPPNVDYHCEYVRDWVAVKNAYDLEIDDAERAAIEAILGDGIHHATGATQHGVYLSGEESAARFSMGMARNGGCAFYTEGAAQDLVDIVISITPEERHLGKSSNIYILAFAGTQLYAVTSAGQLTPIDADPDQLVAFASLEFMETYEFTLYKGYLGAPFEAQFFIGYWPDGGELIYTPTPVGLVINPGSNQ